MSELDVALVICRFLHYTAALLLFGTRCFEMLAGPVIARALGKLSWRIVASTTVAAIVTSVLWLVLQSAEVGDSWSAAFDPTQLGAVLFGTAFGRVWQWHIIFALALFCALIWSNQYRLHVQAVIAALFLGSLGFVGHAVMRSGVEGWILSFSHITHLLAAGFWLGALPPLAASIRLTNDHALGAPALVALQRFSGLGHLAVASIVLSGVANAWLILGTSLVGPTSPYQVLLFSKIGLVSIMIVLAALNRYALSPMLRSRDAVTLLRLSVTGEIALGLSVVALVSVLGTLSPAG